MVGRTILHYQIVEKLGAGGMGVVYRAQDLKLGRDVALKFLSPELTRDRESEARFEREARTASALNHPNICTIYAIDELDGQRFIAMELLEGQSLHEAIAHRPMPLGTALTYAVQIADALDSAHSQGIVHRDIKPANIFITKRGQAKVLDFGLAKLAAVANGTESSDASPTMARAMLTVRGEALGTIGYMSPEQARAEPLDARTDLFSFGVVLYEMITGQQAFSGPSTAVVFDGILNRMPPPLNLIASDVPAEIEQIVQKALQKDREVRYQSAAALCGDLDQVRRVRESGRLPVTALSIPAAVSAPSAPAATARPAPSSNRRWSRVPAIAGVAGIALVVVIVVGGMRWLARRQPTEAPAAPETTAAAPQQPGADQPVVAPPQPSQSGTPPGDSASVAPGGQATATTPLQPEPAQPRVRPDPVKPSGRTAEPGSASSRKPGSLAVREAPARQTPPTPPDTVPQQPAAADPSATLLAVARAKYDNHLFDQALTDLRTITTAQGAGPSTPAAYLLMGQIHEQQSRPEDAMADYVEMRSRLPGSDGEAEASYRLAQLTLRSKREDRVKTARSLLAEIPARHASSPWAPRALAAKAALETREKIKEADPVIGAGAPAAIASNRMLIERYATAPEAQAALWQLGEAYEDLKRYDLAATAYQDLGTRFPQTRFDTWWRAGEIYEKRLKDKFAARAAYAKVPVTSGNYTAAQKKSK